MKLEMIEGMNDYSDKIKTILPGKTFDELGRKLFGFLPRDVHIEFVF